MTHSWIFFGAVSGFLSVALGAFGAHGLANILSEKSMSVYQTAVQYQMFHSLALLALGIWGAATPAISGQGLYQASAWSFAIGILVFSGSLYALALSGIRVLGAITPIGGVAFLLGWACLAVLAFGMGRSA